MSKLQCVVMVAIVVACGIGSIVSVDRNHQPITRIEPSKGLIEPSKGLIEPSKGPTRSAGSPREPIVAVEPPGDVRKAERSRRAIRPAGDPERKDGWNYDGVLKGDERRQYPKPAEPMPPTYCHTIERAPKPADWFRGPYWVHDRTVDLFEGFSGFGFHRMSWFKNDRGVEVASRDIDRVEMVSLLTDDEPSVYVLDEVATPVLARQANRRPLDEFELLGLNAVRSGEELVWTRESPMRMFGAIRAKADCLHCHAKAKEGDLLGAFTYYLKVPVDQLNMRE
jgi:hypothetical protein